MGKQGVRPAGLLVADEGLLQVTAGMLHPPQAPLTAASHLLTDSPHLCDKRMQRSVQARHAQEGIPVSLPNNLQGYVLLLQCLFCLFKLCMTPYEFCFQVPHSLLKVWLPQVIRGSGV